MKYDNPLLFFEEQEQDAKMFFGTGYYLKDYKKNLSEVGCFITQFFGLVL